MNRDPNIIAIAFIAAVVLFGLGIFAISGDSGYENDQEVAGTPLRQAPKQTPKPKDVRVATPTKSPSAWDSKSPSDAGEPQQPAQPFEEPDMPLDSDSALEPVNETGRTWDDPVNERVLGDPKWMAQPSREMQEQIRNASKKYIREPDPRIKPMERRLAIEAIRPIVDRCFEQAQANVPGLIGRAIVIFEASSAGRKGVIKNVRFGAVVKLDQDPNFRNCVISNAEGLGFDATEAGDERTVEYPFFFDQ